MNAQGARLGAQTPGQVMPDYMLKVTNELKMTVP